MNILASVRINSSPSYHRLIYPHLLMNDPNVFITNDFPEKYFEEKQTDLYIYNRILGERHHDIILEERKKRGFKICVDLDDYWELDASHILYLEYQETEFAKQQLKEIVAADFVTTTNAFLADEIYPWNKNVYVIPNAIPSGFDQFGSVKRTYSQYTRLFWQGSITHEQDIALIEDPISKLGVQMWNKVKMVMGGFEENYRAWQNMADMYNNQGKMKYKLIPGAPVSEYYHQYADADICLVPLCNTRFNRMKSNLKILEAANLGLPVIASAVHPYIGMPVMMCRRSSDWVGHIKRLVNFPKRAAEHAIELKNFCDENYSFEKINLERQQIYEIELAKA